MHVELRKAGYSNGEIARFLNPFFHARDELLAIADKGRAIRNLILDRNFAGAAEAVRDLATTNVRNFLEIAKSFPQIFVELQKRDAPKFSAIVHQVIKAQGVPLSEKLDKPEGYSELLLALVRLPPTIDLTFKGLAEMYQKREGDSPVSQSLQESSRVVKAATGLINESSRVLNIPISQKTIKSWCI